MKESPQYSLCILTTVSSSIKAFYQGQIEALNEAGFKTTVVCSDDEKLKELLPKQTKYHPVSFSRIVSPLQDINAIYKLFRLFKTEKFNIVQYSTPKASLLSSIAAFLAGVPCRIYILWGLYYTGQTSVKRFILKSFEKIICLLSTHIVPIAHEMISLAESEGLAKASKCEVMLNGSACGVDLQRFDPKKWPKARDEIRDKYHIPERAVVIGVVARLTGDKGINELVSAFVEIAEEISYVHLLIVGGQEEKDKLHPQTEKTIKTHPRIHAVGWQQDTIPYYMAMDIFCLPTYREGFGEVNLESQALGLPVVSTNVIGPRESIKDSETGFLVEPKSSKAIVEPLKRLILDPDMRRNIGQRGRRRVEQMFDRKDVIQAVVEHRSKLLARVGRRP